MFASATGLLAGCGSGSLGQAGMGAGGSAGGTPGVDGGGGSGPGGSGPGGSGAGGSAGMMGMGGVPGFGGQVGSIAPGGVPTKLPLVPELVNVVATPNHDSATVTFEPVLGAKDYRIYELPPDANITVQPDGTTVVKDGIYRCGGARFGPILPVDDEPQVMSGAFKALLTKDIRGFRRSMADATLGYVWLSPATGRVPIYAMGDPDVNADNVTCYHARWAATRVKKYVTEQERTQLFDQGWRDDGVAFYVPAPGTAGTRPVLTEAEGGKGGFRLYFNDGPERAIRRMAMPAFDVLAQPAADTVALMRVHYGAVCGQSHDELAAGEARFQRILRQGALPVTDLTWTPLKEEKILVIEALDKGCPYQGILSAKAFPAYGIYEPFFTMEQLRTMVFTGPALGAMGPNPTGEIFVNGQTDGTALPRAIARSFVKLGPRAREKMDWFSSFPEGSTLGEFTARPVGQFQTDYYAASAEYDMTWYAIDDNTVTRQLQWAVGSVGGGLLATYHDAAADTNGKFRLTPLQSGTISAATYLHSTMEVDILSSARRYPQMLISNQRPPVQNNLTMGSTVVIQTFDQWPIQLQIQFCERRSWDVNNQCPRFDLFQLDGKLAPVPDLGEKSGLDRRVRFDVFTSTKRVFVFVDGEPYGCAELPGVGMPEGQATVTIGDVLYHSAADLDTSLFNWYPFHRKHLLVTGRRFFDNFGFSSGRPAPAWNFTRLPCRTQTRM